MSDLLASFDSVESVIADIAAGKMVIVTDDESRENEGDLIIAGEKITAEAVNMMVTHARGLICAPAAAGVLARLGISQMVPENRESHGTAFTASVDAATGISTGISAADRARTIRILADPAAKPRDLVQPGHIFPLRAREGGVLERAGHTEAAVDLAALANLAPAAAICEIMNDDGTMARGPELVAFKKRFGLKLLSIAQLIEYRSKREKLVKRLGAAQVTTPQGAFTAYLYQSVLDGSRHYALTLGALDETPMLVRMHSENILFDIFGVRDFSDSADDVALALARIAKEGRGVFVYVSQPDGGLCTEEGRLEKVPQGRRGLRTYGVGAQILRDLGLKRLRLLSSHPKKVVAIDGWNLEIVSTETL